VVKTRLPTLSISFRFFNRDLLKLFFHFGGIVQLSGLLGIANRSIKKVVAGAFIGLEATGLYEVGEKFPVMSLNLPGSITAVFLPATAQFHASEQEEKIIQIYVRGSRLINLLTGSMMGFMAAFSEPLIKAWLGINPLYGAAASILTWFTFAYQMDTLTGPISAIYRSINRPQRELFYGLIQLVLTVCAIGTGFYFYSPSIEIINMAAASTMVLSAGLYLYRSNEFFNIRHMAYFQSVIIPGLIPYAVGGILWLTMKPFFQPLQRLDTLVLFLFCLFLYLLVWTPLLYWMVLSKTERQEIKTYLLCKKKY
jgi:O-antigen/teichoic acid export membrane protein